MRRTYCQHRLQMLERLSDQAHFAIPSVFVIVDGQVKIEVVTVAPHLELVAEHDFARVARAR